MKMWDNEEQFWKDMEFMAEYYDEEDRKIRNTKIRKMIRKAMGIE